VLKSLDWVPGSRGQVPAEWRRIFLADTRRIFSRRCTRIISQIDANCVTKFTRGLASSRPPGFLAYQARSVASFNQQAKKNIYYSKN